MGWKNTWQDILSGGPTRWKVDDLALKRQALNHIVEQHRQRTVNKDDADDNTTTITKISLSIFCPLAGDDPFVALAWREGHSVTTIDIVPEAVEAMKQQFSSTSDDDGMTSRIGNVNDDWELVTLKQQKPSTKIWKHKSGRATLYEGDMLEERRPELEQQFDAVYDKDSFGALDPTMRPAFCERIATYLKDDGIFYTEVKFKTDTARLYGPPFHLEHDDLIRQDYFGKDFQYVKSLGEVYELSMPGMQQHGHILQRLPRGQKET